MVGWGLKYLRRGGSWNNLIQRVEIPGKGPAPGRLVRVPGRRGLEYLREVG